MSNHSKELDEVINQAAPFAVPILNHLRQLIHDTIPEIEETVKWKMATFELGGKILCSIAPYKKHCAFRFWKGNLMDDPENILQQVGKTDMRHIGNISSMEDLPSDKVMKAYIKNAGKVQ